MLSELVDLRLSQHAAISYQHHPLQSKLLPQLLDLVGYRRRISRVPRIDAHRHRTSLPIRHHSVDDDGQTVLPITVVSKLRERASPPFIKTARHVIEHQPALPQMASGQLLLDALLAFQKPVHGFVQIILGGLGHSQLLGQGGGVPLAGGCQFRAGIDQALNDHGHHQISFPAALSGNQAIQLEPVDHFQDGLNMAVRKGFLRVNRSCGETRGSSRSTRRKVSILSGGQSERLATVRLRVFWPSRQASRRRTAGGELRLGTTSMYMGALDHNNYTLSSINLIKYMGAYWRSRDGTMHTFPTVYPRIQPLLLLELRLREFLARATSRRISLSMRDRRTVACAKVGTVTFV